MQKEKNWKNKLKKIFFEIISFSSPRARIIFFSFFFFLFAIIPVNFFVEHRFKCFFKDFLFPIIFRGNCPTSGFFQDCNCPGCGMTRAFSNFMHGNFRIAITYNYKIFFVIIIIISILIKDIFFILRQKIK